MKGLGDLVKKATDTLKIPQCDECRDKQIRLNEAVPFSIEEIGRRMGEWSKKYRSLKK